MSDDASMPPAEADVRRRAAALVADGDQGGVARLLAGALPGLGYPADLSLALLEAYRRTRQARAFKELTWQLIRSGPAPLLIAREAASRMAPAAPEALDLLRLAAVIEPADPATLVALVTCLDQRQAFAEALRSARRHEVASGRESEVVRRFAFEAWAGRRWASASAWLKRLTEVLPNHPRALSMLQAATEKHKRERAFPHGLPVASLADRLLPRGERTSILYVGARGEDMNVRFRGVPAHRLEVVGVDPELETVSDPAATGIALRYLRDALSDRQEDRTFFETESPGGSSLFGPADAARRYSSPRGMSWGEMLRVRNRHRVRTTTVDAVQERGDLGRVDALYVNVQGSELAVLQGGRQAFGETFAVQAEVAFIPHYEGAPDWRAVDAELVGQGFVLVDIRSLMSAGRARVGFASRPDKRIGYDRWPSWQIAEAHLLYLRDPLDPERRGSGLFRSVRDWLVFALWAEYHGQVEIALEALLALADDPGQVDDPENVAALAAEIGAVVDRYRAYIAGHFG